MWLNVQREDKAMAIENTGNRSVETVQSAAQNHAHSSGRRATLPPQVDIYETVDGIVLRADMPGVSRIPTRAELRPRRIEVRS